MEEKYRDLIENDLFYGDREPTSTRVIMINGLADVPSPLATGLARGLKSEFYDPGWKRQVPLEEMIEKLDKAINRATEEGCLPILMGISAGGALMTAYMCDEERAKKVFGLIFVSALIDPDETKMDLDHLTKTNPTFGDTADYIRKNLNKWTQERINKITIASYRSTGDSVVPALATKPEWFKGKQVDVSESLSHLDGIASALVGRVKTTINAMKKARFN